MIMICQYQPAYESDVVEETHFLPPEPSSIWGAFYDFDLPIPSFSLMWLRKPTFCRPSLLVFGEPFMIMICSCQPTSESDVVVNHVLRTLSPVSQRLSQISGFHFRVYPKERVLCN